jgi:hypothetical protein
MMNDVRKVAQVSTDTKSAIGGTRMSEAATPAVAAGNRVSTTRIVGGAAVTYAASVIVQNAMFVGGVAQLLGLGDGTGAPTYGDPLGVVLAYHAANRGAVAVAAGLEAVNMVLLLLFVTALHGLVQRRGGAGADWSRLAVAAGATLSALFALVIATHIAVVLAAAGLAAPTPTFALIWRLHANEIDLDLPEGHLVRLCRLNLGSAMDTTEPVCPDEPQTKQNRGAITSASDDLSSVWRTRRAPVDDYHQART